MEKRTVTYNQFGVEAELTLAPATVERGLMRTRLVDAGLNHDKDEDALLRMLRWMQFPVIKAGTLEGWIQVTDLDRPAGDERPFEELLADDAIPKQVTRVTVADLTFEQFVEFVPEGLSLVWISDILTLNPHWSLDRMRRQAAFQAGEEVEESPGKEMSDGANS